MAYFDVQFYSKVLGLTCTMGVILPEPDQGIGVDESVWDGVEPLPVLYLLHGMSDNHTIWMRRTSLDRYAAGRTLAIVMPAAGRSYYANQVFGLDYQRFIAEELPVICRRFFRISARREDNFIAGLSMGGYGAMKIALNYPDRYSHVASMSGALDVRLLNNTRAYDRVDDPQYLNALREADCAGYRSAMDFKLCFGSLEEYKDSENDIEALIGRLAQSRSEIPKINLSIGTEDYLYKTNVVIRQKLDACKIPYTYSERVGKHEWAFWDRQIQDVLDWLPVERSIPIGNGQAEREQASAFRNSI